MSFQKSADQIPGPGYHQALEDVANYFQEIAKKRPEMPTEEVVEIVRNWLSMGD